jgi:hypothetical protein
VLFNVRLKDKATGQIIVFSYFADDKNSIDFEWNEGNMSCDCNRYVCFYGYCNDDITPCNTDEGDQRFELIAIEEAKG